MRSRPRHRSSSRMEWVWISTRYLHKPSSRLVSARGPYVTLTHTLPAYLPGNVIIVDCTARQGCNSLRSFIAGCLSQRCPLLCFQFNLLSSPCRAKHPNTHYVSGAGAWQSLARKLVNVHAVMWSSDATSYTMARDLEDDALSRCADGPCSARMSPKILLYAACLVFTLSVPTCQCTMCLAVVPMCLQPHRL